MLGSLNDFIEVKTAPLQFKLLEEEDEITQHSIIKYSRRKTLKERSRRTVSGIDQYIASDKSVLIEKFAKNFPNSLEIKQKKSNNSQPQYFTSRKPISEGKIISFFHGQDPKRMKDQIAKDQLRREHNLLRAIMRTKMHEEQKPPNTYYQDSFNRILYGLKNIKIKPVVDGEASKVTQQPKTNRSLPTTMEKRTKSQLKNYTRLQFESCLSWSKKRKKDGSFYARKLGKISQVVEADKSLENRKILLKNIHQRSASVAL